MKNRAIFLDRDGTINVDKDYTYKIEDVEIIPGVIEGLKLLSAKYKLIIITNQSRIGRGYFTEDDYFNFRNEILKELNKKGLTISGEYFCPHNPNENCNCRKPKTGMLEDAARDFNLNLSACWMVGDHLSDIQAGKNAGCRTIHVLTGHIEEPIECANFIANNLVDAANYILSQNK